MGEMIEFAGNGSPVPGYLARPSLPGAGVVVIQEWWGLVDHIKEVCDRFAQEGFTALAPDFYRGAKTTEPDEAHKHMMDMKMPEALKDMSGAVDYLLADPSVIGDTVGVVGFCMGGGLALCLTAQRPEVGACTMFYGVIPWEDAKPDFAKINAAVLGHFAENDASAPPQAVRELEAQLSKHGVDVKMNIFPGVTHAFFNDTRPQVYDQAAADTAWHETTEFFHAHLKR